MLKRASSMTVPIFTIKPIKQLRGRGGVVNLSKLIGLYYFENIQFPVNKTQNIEKLGRSYTVYR